MYVCPHAYTCMCVCMCKWPRARVCVMHADVQMHVCLEWCLVTCVFKVLLDILLTHSHLRTTMKYLLFHLGLYELYLVSNLVFFQRSDGDFLAVDTQDLQIHHPVGTFPVSSLHLPDNIQFKVNLVTVSVRKADPKIHFSRWLFHRNTKLSHL